MMAVVLESFLEKAVALPEGMTVVCCTPGIMGGMACVHGTRIPALMVVGYLRRGASHEEIFGDYPSLPAGSIEAVTAWAQIAIGLDWLTRPKIEGAAD